MRWFHESIDRLHVALINLFKPRAFRQGTSSPTLQEHLAAVQFDLPPLTTQRRYRLTAQTLVGALEVGYRIRLGPRPELPVLVYHHGIAEMPYDKSFRGIFPARHPINAHLVAVRAPFHRSWLTVFSGLVTLSNFVAMCAVSIKLIEAVRQLLAAHGAQHSVVAGTSLGGFLALMHHLNFSTADRYVPLLAGPDIADAMLSTHFRRFLAPAEALAQADHIRSLLDFRQAFQASDTRHVLPLLAQYDLDMRYDHHRACYTACGVPVVTIARGHITGAITFAALRAHLLTCMAPLAQVETTSNNTEGNTWLQP